MLSRVKVKVIESKCLCGLCSSIVIILITMASNGKLQLYLCSYIYPFWYILESSCTSNDESNSFIVDSIASLTSNESYNSIIEESITSNNVEIDKSTFSDSLLSNSNASLDAAVEKRNVFESSDEESDIHFKNRLSR